MRKAHILAHGALVAVAVAAALATQRGVALADSVAPPPGGHGGGGFKILDFPGIALCVVVVVGALVVALIRGLSRKRRRAEAPPENPESKRGGWDFRM